MIYRSGIIGTGEIAGMGTLGLHDSEKIGQEQFQASHVGGYSATDEIELVAIGDIDEEKLRQFGEAWDIPEERQYAGHEKMLADESLDVVSVCSPTVFHSDHVCRKIPASAKDAVFTYLNDISNRDDQEIKQNWIRGKIFDNSAPFRLVVATPDEVPNDAYVRLRVNDEQRQNTRQLEFIFTVPQLIEDITVSMTLEPGDIISTGTPAGIGLLGNGDDVKVEIEGIGMLQHTVCEP